MRRLVLAKKEEEEEGNLVTTCRVTNLHHVLLGYPEGHGSK
jgi:hypothetical protein